jgi:hypothetical protein
MVLLNASSRARNAGQTINQNQGGGNKKAGFPHQIGRESWTSMFLNATDPAHGRCCTLTQINTTFRMVRNISRPVGLRPGAAYGFPNIH